MKPRPYIRSSGVTDSGRASARRAIDRCQALLAERGNVSGASLANEALEAYQALSDDGLATFFDFLARRSTPDTEVLERCEAAYRARPSHATLIQLQQAVESPCQELFRRLNLAHGGTAALIEMRARLLRGVSETPAWAAVEASLASLLSCWFNGGFLELRRINRRTPATVLENLMKYEAVHHMRDWRDLQRRLQADRRCFALFHPALPDEPVVFTELALTSGLSACVQPLLDPDSPVLNPSSSDCALFYSISSCHEGLRGVPFGNALIRRVIDSLTEEFPRLTTFATLSPVPGFRRWLNSLEQDRARPRNGVGHLVSELDALNWAADVARSARLERELVPLCAFYLLRAKRGEEPADPVARFHLGNGARLERLNWLGDCSEAGLHRSAGFTVNYLYQLSDIERNHRAYVMSHRATARRRLESLARQAAAHLTEAIPA